MTPLRRMVFLDFKMYVPSFLYTQTYNTKSEQMHMRRARAYSSFCSHVFLIYVHPFRCSSLFCSRKSQKMAARVVRREISVTLSDSPVTKIWG